MLFTTYMLSGGEIPGLTGGGSILIATRGAITALGRLISWLDEVRFCVYSIADANTVMNQFGGHNELLHTDGRNPGFLERECTPFRHVRLQLLHMTAMWGFITARTQETVEIQVVFHLH